MLTSAMFWTKQPRNNILPIQNNLILNKGEYAILKTFNLHPFWNLN